MSNIVHHIVSYLASGVTVSQVIWRYKQQVMVLCQLKAGGGNVLTALFVHRV